MTMLDAVRVATSARQVLVSLLMMGIVASNGAVARAAAARPPATPKLDPLQVAAQVADEAVIAGKPVDALAGYAAALAQVRTTLSAEALASAQAKLEALKAEVAELALEVNEANAEVQLDGADAGRTPFAEALRMNPGSHAITLKKPGFVTISQQVVLARGPASQRLMPS